MGKDLNFYTSNFSWSVTFYYFLRIYYIQNVEVQWSCFLYHKEQGCVNSSEFSVCKLECQVIVLTLAVFNLKYNWNNFQEGRSLPLFKGFGFAKSLFLNMVPGSQPMQFWQKHNTYFKIALIISTHIVFLPIWECAFQRGDEWT